MSVVLPPSASKPVAVFSLPLLLFESAKVLTAVLPKPVVLLRSASSPRTVFSFVKQPSWQTARTWGESAKQASTSAVRNKPYRKGDRPIDFPKCRVVIFFVEVGFLNCINCNPVPRGTRDHPTRRFEQPPHFG